MMTNSNWLLPAYLSDILPAEARRIEHLRRQLLDLYRCYGFELVAPPLLEFTESLFAGTQQDLQLKTCKVVDQVSGRTMGIRPDTTSQVTRIDAHLLNRQGVTRLCYCGPVFHALPEDLLGDRELLQIGAEIYGYSGYQADLMIISLALKSLELAGIKQARIDLTHTGITQALIKSHAPLKQYADKIYACLREKDTPTLEQLLNSLSDIPKEIKKALCVLPTLYGNQEIIQKARTILPPLDEIVNSLDKLEKVANHFPEATVDLADVRGYDYHTDITFSIYIENWHNALVRGGRYDNSLSTNFGRPRAATGFSFDLRKLVQALPTAVRAKAVLAPWSEDDKLNQVIDELRAQGQTVVQKFPDSIEEVDEFEFTQELVKTNGQWHLVPLH